MNEDKRLNQLNERLDEVNRRLNGMDEQLQRHRTSNSRGDMSWIWALVPIAVIVMWGLTNIL